MSLFSVLKLIRQARQAVETAQRVLAHCYGLASKGALTESDAKTAALQVIKDLRDNCNEYLWINGMQPQMVMHRIKPELGGTRFSEHKDSDGKVLYVDAPDVVRAEGGGFIYSSTVVASIPPCGQIAQDASVVRLDSGAARDATINRRSILLPRTVSVRLLRPI